MTTDAGDGREPGAARPVKLPPWDPEPRWSEHGVLLSVQAGRTELARYVDGVGSPAFDSPRPHLHPVRTPSGVLVSDAAPVDHTWHLGLGIAVQDVAGANLWGGRTYLRDDGYTWRRDHGRTVHAEWLRREPGAVRHRLLWQDPSGATLLEEVRELSWTVLDGAWRLDLASTLALPAGAGPVELGSPATNGRELAGYGGLFWRLPVCVDVDVRTPAGHGEDAVHGSVPADGAAWLAWSARAAARKGEPDWRSSWGVGAEDGGEFTVAVAPADERTAQDPWFVRVTSYPGLGSALAWQDPLVVGEHEPVHRAFTIVVADGRLDDDRVAELVTGTVDDETRAHPPQPTGAGPDREDAR